LIIAFTTLPTYGINWTDLYIEDDGGT